MQPITVVCYTKCHKFKFKFNVYNVVSAYTSYHPLGKSKKKTKKTHNVITNIQSTNPIHK